MRKPIYEMATVKERIASLRGKKIKMVVHRGRKRYSKFTGILENTYPSVFTVRIDNPKSMDIMTYAYADILCGDVRIAALETAVHPKQTVADVNT